MEKRVKVAFWALVLAWAVLCCALLWMAYSREPEQVVEVTRVEEVTYTTAHYEAWEVSTQDAEMLARLVWGEGRGCNKTNQAAVIWCVLNRVDDPRFPDSIRDVILQDGQFYYLPDAPVTPELFDLACDVLARWRMEDVLVDSGRVLPKEYCWFRGNGTENVFRDAYQGGTIWNWVLESPYE